MKRTQGGKSHRHCLFRTLLTVGLAVGLGTCRPAQEDFPLVNAFEQTGSETTKGISDAEVGEPLIFGLSPFQPIGTSTVRLIGARIIGVPTNLQIDGISATRISETHGLIAANRGEEMWKNIQPALHPLADVTFSRDDQVDFWYLIVRAHLEQPASVKTKGIEIRFMVDGKRGKQSFPYRIGVEPSAKTSP